MDSKLNMNIHMFPFLAACLEGNKTAAILNKCLLSEIKDDLVSFCHQEIFWGHQTNSFPSHFKLHKMNLQK
jgi:hypothetical protein